MAKHSDFELNQALPYLRAVELARSGAASRCFHCRARAIASAAARVEALLLTKVDNIDELVDDCREGLRSQSRPGCLLVLHTDTRKQVGRMRQLCDKLLDDVILGTTSVVRVAACGLMGPTLSGHMLEVENGVGILLVLLPHGLARVVFGQDVVAELPCLESSADALAMTLLCTNPFGSRLEGDGAPKLPGLVFGGIVKKIEVRSPPWASSRWVPEAALGIVWLRATGPGPGAAAAPAPSAALAHVQAISPARLDVRRQLAAALKGSRYLNIVRRQLTEALLQEQAKDFKSLVDPPLQPRAVAAFACNDRGESFYGEPNVEAILLDEVFCAEGFAARAAASSGGGGGASAGGCAARGRGVQRPPIFGAFCGGEIGPEPERESRLLNSQSQFVERFSWKVAPASAKPRVGSTHEGLSSGLQGYTTMVGVIG